MNRVDGPYDVLDREFAGASDRAAAVVAAAFLDEFLNTLLQAVMVEDSSERSDLFKPAQPLGSFMAKVRLSLALGLIDESEKRRLALVAKIRNDFAHVTSDLSFTTPAIADRCRQLAFPIEMVAPRTVPSEIDLETLKDFRIPLADRDSPRALFEEATLCLLYVLKGRLAQAMLRRPTAPKPYSNPAEPAGEYLAIAMVQRRMAIERGRPPEDIEKLRNLVETLSGVVVYAKVGSMQAGQPVSSRPPSEWQAMVQEALAKPEPGKAGKEGGGTEL
ncbi:MULTISPECIES: hypothetical protein [Stenotrophomonas]|uniref:hypothetical protein n=1 Tax=Stenotrophomonas TaxID=40323 RepID=UPI0009A1AFD1|nr:MULTISPECIES: hypothetical protein [Stenotrophomonas]